MVPLLLLFYVRPFYNKTTILMRRVAVFLRALTINNFPAGKLNSLQLLFSLSLSLSLSLTFGSVVRSLAAAAGSLSLALSLSRSLACSLSRSLGRNSWLIIRVCST